MRIPPSVIVMSVVTAVPFGLGVRETLANRGAPAGDEYGDGLDFGGKRSARERERAMAEYEAELRREAEEREARNVKRVAQLDQLYGAKVASMGALLDGIVIGANAGSFQPEHVRDRIARVTRDGLIDIEFEPDAASLNAVTATVDRGIDGLDACEQLGGKLAAAWGPSTRNAWLDPATHQRAAFDTEACQLRFDRYLEPAEWVSKLPMHLIGVKVDKLTAELAGVVDEETADGIWWHMPGLRHGWGDTKLEAYIENGKVIAIRARVDSDFDSTVAVREAIAAQLKAAPKLDSDTGYYMWNKRVPVALDQTVPDRFTVTLGRMPWD